LRGSNDVQAPALFEEQMNQIGLGVNGAVLQDHKHGQQTVRNDEEEDQQWQHCPLAVPPNCRTYRVIHLFPSFPRDRSGNIMKAASKPIWGKV